MYHDPATERQLCRRGKSPPRVQSYGWIQYSDSQLEKSEEALNRVEFLKYSGHYSYWMHGPQMLSPKAEMGRRQCKSTYNNMKNKTSPESSPPLTPRPEHCNVDKTEENDLKNSLMKMIKEALEGKMKNAVKEIEEKTNKKLEEMNKEIEEKNKKIEEMSKEIEDKNKKNERKR
ncbi:hypothetical protein STEG23_031098 [Scotinomys teguina]